MELRRTCHFPRSSSHGSNTPKYRPGPCRGKAALHDAGSDRVQQSLCRTSLCKERAFRPAIAVLLRRWLLQLRSRRNTSNSEVANYLKIQPKPRPRIAAGAGKLSVHAANPSCSGTHGCLQRTHHRLDTQPHLRSEPTVSTAPRLHCASFQRNLAFRR